jgi:methylmalonyl-CoA decarboxylase
MFLASICRKIDAHYLFSRANARRSVEMPLVLTSTQDDIGFITLNHERKKNALSEPLVCEIITALTAFREQRMRAAVLRAQPGTTVWSAGHDVTELPESRRDPLEWQDPLRHLIREIENFPAPVIAMIEGTVWGGACETAFACDLIVAAPNATFAVTPAKLGVPYNVSGMVTFLNAASLRIIKEMAFTAQPMTADRAETLGMINYVVPLDELESFTVQLARKIAANAPLSISVMKEQLRILAGARPMSPQGFERVQGLRRVVYSSEDYQEGIRAFKEKRKPVYKGQ